MTKSKFVSGFVDPPGPFGSLEEWEVFAREFEAAFEGPFAAEVLAEARDMIAKKKAAQAAGGDWP